MRPLVLALPGNEPLAQALAARAGFALGTVEARALPDGETYVRILPDAHPRDRDVAIVGSLIPPNAQAMALLFLAGTARDMGARRIGAVCPYLAYLRQDRRKLDGEALTASYFAEILSGSLDWLVTLEPHVRGKPGLTHLYSIPTRSLAVTEPITAWLRREVKSPLLIGPDEGSRAQIERIAEAGGFPFAILRKARVADDDVRIEGGALPELRGKTPVLVDDILSTGGTMAASAKRIVSAGGTAPICLAVHGVFAQGAEARLKAAGVGRVVTCNTISHATNAIDVTGIIADALGEILG